MPAPAPAYCIGRLRGAVVDSGAQTNPLATPNSAMGNSSSQIGVSGVITAPSQNSATAKQTSPNPATQRGCARSASRPPTGDSAPDTPAIGTNSSADWVGVRSSTPCAKKISGNDIEVTPNPTVAMASAAMLKLRSRNSDSEISGSALLRACQSRNTPSTTIPAMISDQTEIGPAIVPQS